MNGVTEMNEQAIKETLSVLKAKDLFEFDMMIPLKSLDDGRWKGCVLGAAVIAAGRLSEVNTTAWADHPMSVYQLGMEFFGLPDEAANEIFAPTSFKRSFSEYKRRHAKRMLKHLLKTGEVDWERMFWK
jgi:hypothetical protein